MTARNKQGIIPLYVWFNEGGPTALRICTLSPQLTLEEDYRCDIAEASVSLVAGTQLSKGHASLCCLWRRMEIPQLLLLCHACLLPNMMAMD